jgi:hypothetical protein
MQNMKNMQKITEEKQKSSVHATPQKPGENIEIQSNLFKKCKFRKKIEFQKKSKFLIKLSNVHMTRILFVR